MIGLNAKIDVIIVNFNNWRDTLKCIDSVLQNEQSAIHPEQIIVVDNGSTDGSFERIFHEFPEINVLSLAKNIGFAGANNVGIRMALNDKAEYVFLLNNDATVLPDTISSLVRTYENDERIGIVGATILNYQNPTIIDNMGANINYWTGSSRFLNHGSFYNKELGTIDVDYASGAAMMISRKVINKIGLLPEFYFLYCEEQDYCTMAKKSGFRVACTAQARVIHKPSSTINKYVGLKNYYFHRSRFVFLRIHSNKFKVIFAILHSAFVIFPYYTIKSLMRTKTNSRDRLVEVFSLLAGIFDGIRLKTGYSKAVT